MKKYLALFGLLMLLVQPAYSQCGCPVAMPACPCPPPPACVQEVMAPICPPQQVVCQCPPRVVYQTVTQPVIEPVYRTSYRSQQVAYMVPGSTYVTGAAAPVCCPTGLAAPMCCPTGFAAPACCPTGYAAPVCCPEREGFWSEFFGFD